MPRDLFETQGGLAQIKYREVTAVVGDFIYTFLFTGNANRFDVDLPLFEKSLRSFKVLENRSNDDGDYAPSLSEMMSSFAAVLARGSADRGGGRHLDCRIRHGRPRL